MSSSNGGRKRKDQLESDNSEMKPTLTSDTNGCSNANKKMKISEETLVAEGSSSSYLCFACKLKDKDIIKCSIDSCDKFYHKKCLDNLPTSKTEVNLCPLHVCSTCFNLNSRNPQNSKGDMVRCTKCPSAFHNKETCSIPGTVASEGAVTCPKHFSPEKQRNYSGIMKLPFCVQCGCNEKLIYCKTCPAAIHVHCCKRKVVPSDNFTCDRCASKKTISFGDIVWAKVYDFRWWPAQVLKPNDTPDFVVEIRHFEGEFPVKFFGNDEYYWVQMGRVFPFFFRKLGVEDKLTNHNFKKVIDDPHFDNAVELALAAMANRKIQAVEPTNHKKPPYYKYTKCNKPIGKVALNTLLDVSDYNTCGCNSEDPDPCGYDSMCLNRSMCTECHEDTCEAGEKCQNQKFQKLEYAPTKPFYTKTRGWGLKCLKDIRKGTFVNEYCGDLIDEEECERRIKQKQLVGDTNFYFCKLDSWRIIDAGPKGNHSRFMNHSCEPNCETQKWLVLGDGRIGIFAKEDIPAGSELTFDYQMDFSHFEKLKCNCGTKRCSGLIGKKPYKGAFRSDIEEESIGGTSAESETSETSVESETSETSVESEASGEDKKSPNVKPKKADIVKAKKQNGLKADDPKGKKQNGLKGDDPKVKKQNGSKNDDSKVKKQKGMKKDDDVEFKNSVGSKNGNNVKVKKQNGLKKKDNAKDVKQNGLKKDDNKVKKNGLKKDKLLCFKCKTGGKMVNCSRKDCGKSFHVRCLRPGSGPKEKVPPKWECPRHFCKKCRGSSTHQCFMCPNSFCETHVINKPASGRFACPKHSDSD